MSDRGKAIGRGGGGAVFGSKKLYAIAVLPGRKMAIDVADEKNLQLKNKSGASYQARLKLNLGKFTKKEVYFGIWHAWFWETGITDSIGTLDRQSGGNRQAPGQGLLSIL